MSVCELYDDVDEVGKAMMHACVKRREREANIHKGQAFIAHRCMRLIHKEKYIPACVQIQGLLL